MNPISFVMAQAEIAPCVCRGFLNGKCIHYSAHAVVLKADEREQMREHIKSEYGKYVVVMFWNVVEEGGRPEPKKRRWWRWHFLKPSASPTRTG